jgi:Spy/CpxP family protein refolding chaperone
MIKLVIILGFALSFAAGMVIGSYPALVHTAPANPVPVAATAPVETRSRGWLSAQLGLTAEQRQQLNRIWSDTAREGRGERDERRRQYRRERDEAIAELVPSARLAEYDEIINTYSERVAELERESRDAYVAAVERTKTILTPEQRTRYEELLQRHQWGPGAARDRHTSRRSETHATSQPDRSDPTRASHDSLKGAP